MRRVCAKCVARRKICGNKKNKKNLNERRKNENYEEIMRSKICGKEKKIKFRL